MYCILWWKITYFFNVILLNGIKSKKLKELMETTWNSHFKGILLKNDFWQMLMNHWKLSCDPHLVPGSPHLPNLAEEDAVHSHSYYNIMIIYDYYCQHSSKIPNKKYCNLKSLFAGNHQWSSCWIFLHQIPQTRQVLMYFWNIIILSLRKSSEIIILRNIPVLVCTLHQSFTLVWWHYVTPGAKPQNSSV